MSSNAEKNQQENNISPSNINGITPAKENGIKTVKESSQRTNLSFHVSKLFDQKRKRWKYFAWSKYVELEVLLLLHGCVVALVIAVQDRVIYHEMCMKEFSNETHWCYDIEKSHNITSELLRVRSVKLNTSSHRMYLLLIQQFVAFVSSTFLCPWSDLYGRKFPLIISIITGNFDCLLFYYQKTFQTSFMVEIYVMSILSNSFGGHICLLSMSYSYVADHSSKNIRTFRYTFTNIAFMVGMVAGVTIFSTLHYKAAASVSLQMIFGIRLVSVILVGLLFLDRDFKGQDQKLCKKFKSVFSMYSVNLNTLTRWRRDCGCEQLQLLILSAWPVFVTCSTFEGLFTYSAHHATFFENFETYADVVRYFTIYNILCEAFCILFLKFFADLKDAWLGLMGFFSLYLYSLGIAFCHDRLTYIVACSLAPFRSFAAVAIRSITSKIIEADERGKTFLILVTCETFAVVLGFVFHVKFDYLVGDTYPEIFHLILCTLLIIPFCAFSFQIISIQTKHLFSRCYRTFQIPNEIYREEQGEQDDDENSVDQ